MSALRTFSVSRETRRGNIKSMVDTEDGVFIIHADPLHTPTPTGGEKISMGFPVLLVSGWVGDPEAFAKRVAALLQEAQL